MNQPLLILIGLIPLLLVSAVVVWGITYAGSDRYSGPRGKTIVRCREGHLFTTIWIPFISFKSIRLGSVRIQRCPIGNNVTLVTPVRESELTEDEKWQASQIQDSEIP